MGFLKNMRAKLSSVRDVEHPVCLPGLKPLKLVDKLLAVQTIRPLPQVPKVSRLIKIPSIKKKAKTTPPRKVPTSSFPPAARGPVRSKVSSTNRPPFVVPFSAPRAASIRLPRCPPNTVCRPAARSTPVASSRPISADMLSRPANASIRATPCPSSTVRRPTTRLINAVSSRPVSAKIPSRRTDSSTQPRRKLVVSHLAQPSVAHAPPVKTTFKAQTTLKRSTVPAQPVKVTTGRKNPTLPAQPIPVKVTATSRPRNPVFRSRIPVYVGMRGAAAVSLLLATPRCTPASKIPRLRYTPGSTRSSSPASARSSLASSAVSSVVHTPCPSPASLLVVDVRTAAARVGVVEKVVVAEREADNGFEGEIAKDSLAAIDGVEMDREASNGVEVAATQEEAGADVGDSPAVIDVVEGDPELSNRVEIDIGVEMIISNGSLAAIGHVALDGEASFSAASIYNQSRATLANDSRRLSTPCIPSEASEPVVERREEAGGLQTLGALIAELKTRIEDKTTPTTTSRPSSIGPIVQRKPRVGEEITMSELQQVFARRRQSSIQVLGSASSFSLQSKTTPVEACIIQDHRQRAPFTDFVNGIRGYRTLEILPPPSSASSSKPTDVKLTTSPRQAGFMSDAVPAANGTRKILRCVVPPMAEGTVASSNPQIVEELERLRAKKHVWCQGARAASMRGDV